MEKYVLISVYGEGYHSGAEYYESVVLTRDIWERIEENMETEIYLGELDGKHSCVESEIEVDFLEEEDLKDQSDTDNDGDNLYWEIFNTMKSSGYDNVKEILEKIEKDVKALEVYTEVKVKIRKDKLDELMNFVEIIK
nr:hypothetical protein [Clostridioides sp.]